MMIFFLNFLPSFSFTDIQELLMTQSVIALVNGKLWDIHCPLTEDCELRFMHFKEDDCNEANEVK